MSMTPIFPRGLPISALQPPVCIGTQEKHVCGMADSRHISSSYIERQNLTMRMHMRRFTRLTNAFSKKVENHAHNVAIHFMHYNFCRVHQTLRVTPAMEAGLAKTVWEIEDLAALVEAQELQAIEDGKLKRENTKRNHQIDRLGRGTIPADEALSPVAV